MMRSTERAQGSKDLNISASAGNHTIEEHQTDTPGGAWMDQKVQVQMEPEVGRNLLQALWPISTKTAMRSASKGTSTRIPRTAFVTLSKKISESLMPGSRPPCGT